MSIRRDVRRLAKARFRTWFNDAIDLYLMADLTPRVAATDLLGILMTATISGLGKLQADPVATAAMVYDLLQRKRKELQEPKEGEARE